MSFRPRKTISTNTVGSGARPERRSRNPATAYSERKHVQPRAMARSDHRTVDSFDFNKLGQTLKKDIVGAFPMRRATLLEAVQYNYLATIKKFTEELEDIRVEIVAITLQLKDFESDYDLKAPYRVAAPETDSEVPLILHDASSLLPTFTPTETTPNVLPNHMSYLRMRYYFNLWRKHTQENLQRRQHLEEFNTKRGWYRKSIAEQRSRYKRRACEYERALTSILNKTLIFGGWTTIDFFFKRTYHDVVVQTKRERELAQLAARCSLRIKENLFHLRDGLADVEHKMRREPLGTPELLDLEEKQIRLSLKIEEQEDDEDMYKSRFELNTMKYLEADHLTIFYQLPGQAEQKFDLWVSEVATIADVKSILLAKLRTFEYLGYHENPDNSFERFSIEDSILEDSAKKKLNEYYKRIALFGLRGGQLQAPILSRTKRYGQYIDLQARAQHIRYEEPGEAWKSNERYLFKSGETTVYPENERSNVWECLWGMKFPALGNKCDDVSDLEKMKLGYTEKKVNGRVVRINDDIRRYALHMCVLKKAEFLMPIPDNYDSYRDPRFRHIPIPD
jgi:hypothetical protein